MPAGRGAGAGTGASRDVKGSTLGSTYVRVRPPREVAFRRRAEDTVEATEVTLKPRGRVGRGYERVRRALIGPRLATAGRFTSG